MGSYLKLTKLVLGKVAAYGTGIIVTQVIANNVSVPLLPIHKKVAVVVGGVFVAMIIKDAVEAKVHQIFDDTIDLYNEAVEKLKSEGKAA